MATTLELPIKRACEEIGSYSGLEASKKAKADTQSPEYSSFRTFDAFFDRYGDSLEDPWTAWTESLEKLNEECKIEEIKLYLISEGQEDAAKKIQSFEDDLACSIESNPEFRNKGWILRTTPGPYNNYQRLYVGDVFVITLSQLLWFMWLPHLVAYFVCFSVVGSKFIHYSLELIGIGRPFVNEPTMTYKFQTFQWSSYVIQTLILPLSICVCVLNN